MRKKQCLLSGVIFLIAILISSLAPNILQSESRIIDTVYTLSGIMFSIGMGVICTFNPNEIKNIAIFQGIKAKTLIIRRVFLSYFSLTTASYLLSQMISTPIELKQIQTVTITLNLNWLALLFSLVGMLYFILNFLAIHKLSFEITERLIQESN